MEIDFENLTEEAKQALKDNLESIEKVAGVVAFDPSKPITRSDMEQLTIKHQMDGEQREMSVWDTVQMASKGVAFDKHQRTNSENAKVRAALKSVREMESLDDMPDAATLEIVANEMGTTKDNLEASLKNSFSAGDPPAKPPVSKQTPGSGIDTNSKEFKDAVVAAVKEGMGDHLVPTKYHGAFLNDGMKAQAEAALKSEIDKVIAEDPRLKKMAEEVGDDEQRKSVLATVTGMLTSTVDKQARGRITQIAAAGQGDILEEIPGIVKDLVEITKPDELLSKVAPQPINFGASEPGDAALTILSGEKPETVSMAEDNLYEDNLAKRIGQKLVETQAASA